MKQRKQYQISIFIALCILLNISGKEIANQWNLPLWMDSFGTILSAYIFGPVCGAIVGCTGNMISGMLHSLSYLYSFTSIAIGIIVGLLAKRKAFNSLFGTMSASVVVTLASVVISTPFNFLLYNGATGNMWGDGVVDYLKEIGLNQFFSSVIGEFYIDFLDKVITLFALYILIKIYRNIWNRKKEHVQRNHQLMGVALILVLLVSMLQMDEICYADTTKTDKEMNYNAYIQTIYSSDNGLSCGTANDIAQTSNGILWIGTYAGLYRYNGSEFQWMGDYESVRNVNCLFGDEEGRLWIGTNDNGLSIMINEKIVNVVDEASGLPSSSVRSIAECADGDYYIGTSGSMQVLTLNGGLELLNTIPEINYSNSIATDDSGYVASVTASGELFLLKDRKIVYSGKLDDEKEIYNNCTFSDDGELYVGTSDNHIYVFDVNSESLVQQKILECGGLSNVNKIVFSDKNELFVCSDNGVGFFDAEGNYEDINTNKFNNSIDAMTIDYQGDLWFVSSRMGLLRMCKSGFSNIYSKIGMEEKVANSVTYWQECYYFGTDSGLDIVDGTLNQQIENELTQMLKGIRIRCVRTDSKNNLWICTYGKGLIQVNADRGIRIYDSSDGSFGQRGRVVMELSDGTIAAAGDAGITMIQDNQVTCTYRYGEEIGNTMILTLLELEDGTILAGTDGDGITALKDGEVSNKLTRADGLSSNVILRTVADREGNGVFIVTSNGLCYMDSDWKIRLLDNFPYFNNYDVWSNGDGELFVLGSAGIYVADRDSVVANDENMEFELLNAQSGLTSVLTANSWDYCDENGNLFLCCDSGVFYLNLYEYTNMNRSYRMMLSGIKMNDTSYQLDRGDTISISRDIEKIELFPEVINYSIDDPYVSYYLEGFDKNPTVVLQSQLKSIVYTNLPKGEYTFHISVLDHKKNSVLEERSYLMIKEKAIYDNQWFKMYMLLVFMLAVSWFTWFIVRTQIQRTINFQKKELAFAKEQVKMGNETILAIARTVDAKDVRTSQHSVRVSEYSVMLAERLGFTKEECENLRKAALLHDIGKIGIADKVLNKTERLTDEEYAIMKSHVLRGADILKDFTLVNHVVDGAMYHHERYDGTGYVKGLKGEEIPIYARIIGVADAFDAMTSNRVYRDHLDIEYVLKELERGRGTQFDPIIDDILLDLIREKKIDMEAIYLSDSKPQHMEEGEEKV